MIIISGDMMNAVNLLNAAEFSASGPVKKDLMKTAGSNIVIVGLETGQVIPPHPEPYAVVFVVLQGEVSSPLEPLSIP